MTDEAALRAAVQQSPHDWTPRLVLADYLDDHGTEPHHAEEATRIRQAADPSTPLGRAVAESRKAWNATATGAPVFTAPGVAKGQATHSAKLVHAMIHDPNPDARRSAAYAVANLHVRYVVHHNRAADRDRAAGGSTKPHEAIANAHGNAGMWLRGYAHTL